MSISSAGSSADGVERVAVEVLPEGPSRRPTLVASQPPPVTAPEAVAMATPPTQSDLLHAAFTAIAKVLAVRLQLLLSLIGAFVLAMGAMAWQTPAGLWVLTAWCILAVLPLVWLEWGGRPRR